MAKDAGQQTLAKDPGDLRRNLDGVQKEVAQILYDLAKTARSFGFYARNNKAISQFLDGLFVSLTDFLESSGTLWLGVAADRFIYDGQVVFYEADRESGLPFRLYRDGVRMLALEKGLAREEMEDFLELLARRPSTGRDAEEDDLVTMLWRRSFDNIKYQAVEGFTHDLHAAGGFGEGSEQGGKGGDSGQAIPRMMQQISGRKEIISSRERSFADKGRGRVARSFVDDEANQLLEAEFGAGEDDAFADAGGEEGLAFAAGLWPGSPHYPLPLLGGLAEVTFEALTEEEKASIRVDLDHENELGLLHLLDYCFELCVHEPKYFTHTDFAPLIGPIRRYLIRQRDMETYRRLLRYLRGIAESSVYPPILVQAAAEMVKECSSGDALTSLVAAVTGDNTGEAIVWDILQQLLPDLESDDLLRLLGHSMSAQMATILAGTLVRRTRRDLSLYEQAIDGTDVALIFAALRCLDVLRTAEAAALVERTAESPDPAIRRAAVRILGRVPVTGSSARVFSRLLRDDSPEVLTETLGAVDRQGDPRFAAVLGKWLDEGGFKESDQERRRRLVLLVADLDGSYAETFFGQKLDASMGRLAGLGRGAAGEWRELAVEGLAAVGSDAALTRLRLARPKGNDEFKQFVGRLLAEKRRENAP